MRIYKKYFNKYKSPFFVSVFCVISEAICDLLGPTIMALVINEGIKESSIDSVLKWGGLMILVTAFGAVFGTARNFISSSVSQRLGADLRFDLFKKILRFSEESVDRIESGSLITRMTNDVNQVTQFVNGTMRIFFKAPVTCIGSIVLASLLNFRLSLILYGVVAVIAGCIIISMKMSYPRFATLQKAMDKLNSSVQEYLMGVRLVKAFGTYAEETDKFEQANTGLYRRSVSAQMVITLISPIMTLAVGLGSAAVLFLGAELFSFGLTNPGDISAFTIYMAQMLTSMMMITNIFNTFVRTKASNERILQIFDAEPDFDGGEVKDLAGGIAFENVTFAYPGSSGVPALEDISFSAKPGESLAVIGPTGSGKSTLAWLMLRFYDPDSGRITLGREDIKNADITSLRESVAIVPQKPMLFSGTVSDNIRWGRKSASDEEIKSAAARAQAGFIDDMHGGFSSMLGSRGVNISGGQKQRISIARGLVKNARVLILDDATSALDAVTEAKVRRELMVKNDASTLVMITQRCTTAMFADKILVLENGRNVGFGNHDELMETCETYREIYDSQVTGMREVGANG